MLYVIARIDEKSRLKLENIQSVSEQFGIISKPVHGHITLITYDGGNENELIKFCKMILGNQKEFSVFYEKIEVLAATSIIVASLRKAEELQKVQEMLASKYCEYIAEWMRKDTWYPHTTLLYDEKANLEMVAEDMKKSFEAFEAKVVRIEFSRETEDGFEIVDTVELV